MSLTILSVTVKLQSMMFDEWWNGPPFGSVSKMLATASSRGFNSLPATYIILNSEDKRWYYCLIPHNIIFINSKREKFSIHDISFVYLLHYISVNCGSMLTNVFFFFETSANSNRRVFLLIRYFIKLEPMPAGSRACSSLRISIIMLVL